MYKNELFQSLGTKNELFKVQWQKTKLMYSLATKTIFGLKFLFDTHLKIMQKDIGTRIKKKCNILIKINGEKDLGRRIHY